MNDWYYAKNGRQHGPMTLQALQDLLRSGGLDPNTDLVWAPHIKDWKLACQVEELRGWGVPLPLPGTVPDLVVVGAVAVEGDIVPGSDPILVGDCITRGFELTKKHFSELLLVGLAYFGILMGLGIITSFIEEGAKLLFVNDGRAVVNEGDFAALAAPVIGIMIITNVIYQVASIYLNLGLTRYALNLVSGRAVEVGQLFGEGDKLLRALGASILFFLAVLLGCVFLIVPGIYLALRFGQYLTAIVDRDMGVFEAFAYSSQITQNNLWQLLGLGILCSLIAMAGMLLCCVGMIFTGPVAWLAWVVGYRWLQSGRAVVQQPV